MRLVVAYPGSGRAVMRWPPTAPCPSLRRLDAPRRPPEQVVVVVPAGMDELFSHPDPERARRAMEAMLKLGKLDVAELQAAADGAATG